MKKAIVILLTGAMMMAAVACGSNSSSSAPAAETPAEETQTEETEETVEGDVVEEAQEEGPIVPEEPISYEEYMAAEMDSEVVIRGAVQAKQAYYSQEDSGSANVYLQDENGGAYFLYNLPCTPKEYELLEIGKFIKVKGYKSEWSGEVEVIDAVWMFEDGEYIAEPEDVTALLGTDELIQKQNKFVSFKGVKIEPIGFLIIKDGVVRMVNVTPPASNTVDRVIDLVPQVMDRIDAFIDKHNEGKNENK